LSNNRSSWDEQKRSLESEVAEKSHRFSAIDCQVGMMREEIGALTQSGGAAADDVIRLKQEKEKLQDLLVTSKDAHSRTTSTLIKTQETNEQLTKAHQRLSEEIQQARFEISAARSGASAAEARRASEAAESSEELSNIRRIARISQMQYEELQKQHQKCIQVFIFV